MYFFERLPENIFKHEKPICKQCGACATIQIIWGFEKYPLNYCDKCYDKDNKQNYIIENKEYK